MVTDWEKEMAVLKWWLSGDYKKGVPMPYADESEEDDDEQKQ